MWILLLLRLRIPNVKGAPLLQEMQALISLARFFFSFNLMNAYMSDIWNHAFTITFSIFFSPVSVTYPFISSSFAFLLLPIGKLQEAGSDVHRGGVAWGGWGGVDDDDYSSSFSPSATAVVPSRIDVLPSAGPQGRDHRT